MSEAYTYIPTDCQIPRLYSQENESDPIVHVKLFTAAGPWTWLLTEYDPEEDLAFGFAYNASMPECAELGNISIREIRGARDAFGLRIERDIFFDCVPLSEAKKKQCNIE
jgi:hypothetical protein